MVWPTEKDVETMPTQKIFKQRVRARMSKTGESYTAARRQLLRKAQESDGDLPATAAQAVEPAVIAERPAQPDLMTSDAVMRRGTGRGHDEWFAILDAWGATDHNHTEIATWLRDTQGVPGWWSQNVTVNYERARGMRDPHQQRDGYTISVTRTVTADPETALAAFTSAPTRRRWLPDAPMRQRPTRAALVARFDWSDPVSRVVVGIVAKGSGKALVSVTHEKLPDPATAARLKTAWRGWLGDLKAELERS